MSAIEQIKIDEGFKGKPYLDTVGKTTIGYGRNLDDNPLTEEEAEYLLKNDLDKTVKEAVTLRYYSKLNPKRRAVIINMLFNLGMTRFKGFKRMHAAITAKDFDLAAVEMLDSKWARQVGDRAIRLSKQMSRGI